MIVAAPTSHPRCATAPGSHETLAPQGVQVRCVHGAPTSGPTQLPPYGGNSQLGCGLVVREIKGHRYLYFWAYEARSWGSRRKWTYVGAIADPRTQPRARDILVAYHLHARQEIDRRVAALLNVAARRG